MEAEKKLEGLLIEMNSKLDEHKIAQEEAKEKFKQYESDFGKLSDKLSQLEAAGIPTMRKPNEMQLPIPGTNDTTRVWCGKSLDIQGLNLRDAFERDSVSPRPLLKNHFKLADPEKRERYAKWLLDVIAASARRPDPEAALRLKTVLTTATAATAGYLVPDEYMAEILALARLQSVCLRDCTVVPMGTDVKRLPAELTQVAVVWEAAEITELEESNPTLAEVVLTAKRLGAHTIATNDLLEDAEVDVVSWLTSQFSEALGLEIDNQVFAGTNATPSPVSGLTTAICGYSVITTGSISTVTGTNLSSMIAKLSANKKIGAKFYMHREVFHHIRTLTATDGAFLYNPIGQAQSNTIWGYPYEEAEKMPSTDGTGKPFALFGNLRYFYIGNRRQQGSLDVDPYGLFTHAQTRFRIYWRMALATGLASAFVRAVTA